MKQNLLLNSRGQGLVEYLILIAIMGIASIAIIRSLNDVVTSKFANVAHSLNGSTTKVRTESIRGSYYKKKDMSNFFNGSAREEDGRGSR